MTRPRKSRSWAPLLAGLGIATAAAAVLTWAYYSWDDGVPEPEQDGGETSRQEPRVPGLAERSDIVLVVLSATAGSSAAEESVRRCLVPLM